MFAECSLAFQDQQMLQSNGSCLLSGLAEGLNVNDMANELMIGNDTEDQLFEDVYTIKVKRLLLRKEDRRYLIDDMDTLCKQSVLIQTEDQELSKEEYEALLEKDADGQDNAVVISNSAGPGLNDSCWIQVIIEQL